MPGSTLRFEHDYGLPPEIVWDALIDSDLVSGWLAEADIEARIGGRYDLEWRHFASRTRTEGEIVDLVEPERLVVDTSNFGVTAFTLHPLSDGPRGRSTRVAVDIAALADRQFSAMIAATWIISLDQLDELLRGHPVDWSAWREERGAEWVELVTAAGRRS